MTASHVMTSRPRASKRPARRPKVVDAAFVERAALSYLDRFDATAAKLRQVLLRRCRTAQTGAEPEVARSEAVVAAWVDELLERYLRSGLLDDQRYARNAADSLRRRGSSRQKIVAKLRQKGVPEAVIADVLSEQEDSNPLHEFEAARALAKRRRLGPFRRGDTAPDQHRKDLATLARAGFSYDVASRALGPSGDEF